MCQTRLHGKDADVLWVRPEGLLTLADILENRQEMSRLLSQTPNLHELIDLTGVTELQITSEDVYVIAWTEKRLNLNKAKRLRAVVAPTDFFFGMCRMYEMITEASETEIQVFRDLASAAKWLNLSWPLPQANESALER